MDPNLSCQVYFNSTQQEAPVLSCGGSVNVANVAGTVDIADVASDPAAAHQLIKLGISPRHDLPAVLLREPGGKIRVVGLRLSPEETARLASGAGFPTSRRLVYSAVWCPDCRRAKRVLEEAETPYDEVDIDRDPRAEATVLERSGGRRVIPTLLFDDRLWAFNPDPPLLRRLLDSEPARA